MPSYKSIALLTLLGLSQSHAKGLRKNARRTTSDIITGYAIPEDDIPKSAKDERMDVLSNLDESFISLVDVVEKVDPSNKEQLDRLTEITRKVEAFAPALVDLKKEMNDSGADIEEWDEFKRTMKLFEDLASNIEDKFAESSKSAESVVSSSSSSRKDARTSVLKEMNTLFESLTATVMSVDDTNRSEVEGLEKTAVKLQGLETTLEELSAQMKEEGVEADEWQNLADTAEAYESLLMAVQDKLSEIEFESPEESEEEDESPDEDESEEESEEEEFEDEDEDEDEGEVDEDEDEDEPNKFEEEAEERMNILDEVSELLDTLEEAVAVTEVTEKEGVERLVQITSALKDMEQTFQIVETQMKDKDADAQEWSYYEDSIKKFKHLATSIEHKFQLLKDSQPTEEHQEAIQEEESKAVQEAQQAESFVVDTAKEIINNGKEERMNLMKTLAESFNSLTNVVQDVHDASDIAGLSKIANHLEEYEPTFKYVETQLKEHEADTEEWNKFYDTMKMYENLAATLEDKFQFLADSQLEQNTAVVSEDEADEESDADEKTEESLEENSKATEMDTEISIYADMLTDIHETLESGANPSRLEGELKYIQTKIGQLDQSQVTEQLDQIAVILMSKIQQGKAQLEAQTQEINQQEVQEIAKPKKDLELLNALSEFGFPVGKEVNDILTQEGEAYELNKEEKKELAEDEDIFRN